MARSGTPIEKEEKISSEHQTITIPDVPAQIDLDDLDWSQSPLRLIAAAQILQLKKYSDRAVIPENERISKKTLKTYPGLETIKYSAALVTYTDGTTHCLAYYKGKKQKKLLDEGVYGKVKWAQDQVTGEWHPIKIHLRKSDELKITKHLNVFSEESHHASKSRNRAEQHQIMQFARGKTLEQWMGTETLPHFTEQDWLDMFSGCLRALDDMHANGVMHKDLHANNVIYDMASQQATIIDFGKSKYDPKASPIYDIRFLVQHFRNISGILPYSVNSFKKFKTMNQVGAEAYHELLMEIALNPDSNPLIIELNRSKNYSDAPEAIRYLIKEVEEINRTAEEGGDNLLDVMTKDEILYRMENLILNDNTLKSALFNIVNVSLVRDNEIKVQINAILQSLTAEDITLSQAIQQLQTLKSTIVAAPEAEPHRLSINTWCRLTADEKQHLLNEWLPTDRIVLEYTPDPGSIDMGMIPERVCVEVIRELSACGFYRVSDQLKIMDSGLLDEKYYETPSELKYESKIEAGPEIRDAGSDEIEQAISRAIQKIESQISRLAKVAPTKDTTNKINQFTEIYAVLKDEDMYPNPVKRAQAVLTLLHDSDFIRPISKHRDSWLPKIFHGLLNTRSQDAVNDTIEILESVCKVRKDQGKKP